MLGKSLALTLGLIVATASVSAQSIRWNAFTTNQNASALGIVTNVVEWAAVFGNPTNVIYVSALRGSLNGERNNPLKPFALLSVANDAALPGDTVLVLDGTFAEQLRTKTGVNYWLNRGVRIAPATGDVVVAEHTGDVSITGSGTLSFADPAGNLAVFILSGSAQLYVECAEITNSVSAYYSLVRDGSTPTNCFLRVQSPKITTGFFLSSSFPVEVMCELWRSLSGGNFNAKLFRIKDASVSSEGSLTFSAFTTNYISHVRLSAATLSFGFNNKVLLDECDLTQVSNWTNALNAGNVLGTFYVYQ